MPCVGQRTCTSITASKTDSADSSGGWYEQPGRYGSTVNCRAATTQVMRVQGPWRALQAWYSRSVIEQRGSARRRPVALLGMLGSALAAAAVLVAYGSTAVSPACSTGGPCQQQVSGQTGISGTARPGQSPGTGVVVVMNGTTDHEFQVTADSNGAFFIAVPPGRYELWLHDDPTCPQPATVVRGSTTSLMHRRSSGGRLTEGSSRVTRRRGALTSRGAGGHVDAPSSER